MAQRLPVPAPLIGCPRTPGRGATLRRPLSDHTRTTTALLPHLSHRGLGPGRGGRGVPSRVGPTFAVAVLARGRSGVAPWNCSPPGDRRFESSGGPSLRGNRPPNFQELTSVDVEVEVSVVEEGGASLADGAALSAEGALLPGDGAALSADGALLAGDGAAGAV